MYSKGFFRSVIVPMIAILLSALLLFSFAACGDEGTPEASKPAGEVEDKGGNKKDENQPGTVKDDNPSGKDDEGTKPSGKDDEDIGQQDFDIKDVFGENADLNTVWGKSDAATKQRIIEAAKAEGIDVSFGSDGSMTIIDEDGTKSVQHPDGTWTITDADGTVSQYGGTWPDNEYTRLLPKPDFKLIAYSVEDGEFSVAFSDATVEQLKSYVEKVKAKGFTIDVEVMDENVMGIDIYSFTASNSSGYSVDIASSYGYCGLSLRKGE